MNDESVTVDLPNRQMPVYDPSMFPDQATLNWTFEKRHTAQEIVPGLWVGPLNILRDSQLLQKNNIRVLVSLIDTQIVPAIFRYKYQLSSEYCCYTFDPGHKVSNPLVIVSQLLDICKAIDEAQSQGCGTMLFCESGNDSSAVVAAAYLIYKGVEMGEAIARVQQKRYSIQLDRVGLHNLTTFQDLCNAHRCVGPAAGQHVKQARGREDDDEDDLAMAGTLGTHKRLFR